MRGAPWRSQAREARAAAGRGRRRGGAGGARLARPPRSASITPPPDLVTPGSRWRPSSTRSQEEERGFREATPKRERRRGSSDEEEKQQLQFASKRQTPTQTRARSSGNRPPRRKCAGKVEEGGVSLISSSHPIHPELGHLLQAVPRRRLGACCLPEPRLPIAAARWEASPPRSRAPSPPRPPFKHLTSAFKEFSLPRITILSPRILSPQEKTERASHSGCGNLSP